MSKHDIIRLRHDVRRRLLSVSAVERLTPRMQRITLTAPELHDFVSAGFDDHVKLIFPGSDDTPVMREYTPRSFDAERRQLVLDFALHDAGPATAWALSAEVGDSLEIGGPRGSFVIPDDFDWYMLIGDETALPAIGRRLEQLRPGVPVTSVVIGEAQEIATEAAWTPHWIARQDASDDAALLRAALESQVFLPARDLCGSPPKPRSRAACAATWSRPAAIPRPGPRRRATGPGARPIPAKNPLRIERHAISTGVVRMGARLILQRDCGPASPRSGASRSRRMPPLGTSTGCSAGISRLCSRLAGIAR